MSNQSRKKDVARPEDNPAGAAGATQIQMMQYDKTQRSVDDRHISLVESVDLTSTAPISQISTQNLLITTDKSCNITNNRSESESKVRLQSPQDEWSGVGLSSATSSGSPRSDSAAPENCIETFYEDEDDDLSFEDCFPAFLSAHYDTNSKFIGDAGAIDDDDDSSCESFHSLDDGVSSMPTTPYRAAFGKSFSMSNVMFNSGRKFNRLKGDISGEVHGNVGHHTAEESDSSAPLAVTLIGNGIEMVEAPVYEEPASVGTKVPSRNVNESTPMMPSTPASDRAQNSYFVPFSLGPTSQSLFQTPVAKRLLCSKSVYISAQELLSCGSIDVREYNALICGDSAAMKEGLGGGLMTSPGLKDGDALGIENIGGDVGTPTVRNAMNFSHIGAGRDIDPDVGIGDSPDQGMSGLDPPVVSTRRPRALNRASKSMSQLDSDDNLEHRGEVADPLATNLFVNLFGIYKYRENASSSLLPTSPGSGDLPGRQSGFTLLQTMSSSSSAGSSSLLAGESASTKSDVTDTSLSGDLGPNGGGSNVSPLTRTNSQHGNQRLNLSPDANLGKLHSPSMPSVFSLNSTPSTQSPQPETPQYSNNGLTPPSSSPNPANTSNNTYIQSPSGMASSYVITGHTGAVWSLKFSHDGRFLASAGRDKFVIIWEINLATLENTLAFNASSRGAGGDLRSLFSSPFAKNDQQQINLFSIYRVFQIHELDIIDLIWQSPRRPDVLLSLSLDKAVRVWRVTDAITNAAASPLFSNSNSGASPHSSAGMHGVIKEGEINVRILKHDSMISCFDVHPMYADLVVSGSCQGANKIRVWNLAPKDPLKVGMDTEVGMEDKSAIVTAVAFAPDGRFLFLGMINGVVLMFEFSFEDKKAHKAATYTLKRRSESITCRNRDGKYRSGNKVTGLMFLKRGDLLDSSGLGFKDSSPAAPNLGLGLNENAVLVTTNDHRLRLFGFTETDVVNTKVRQICKFKGKYRNKSRQIKACFSQDAECRYIAAGSDNGYLCIWERAPSDENRDARVGCSAWFNGSFMQTGFSVRNSTCIDRVFCTRSMNVPLLSTTFAPSGTLLRLLYYKLPLTPTPSLAGAIFSPTESARTTNDPHLTSQTQGNSTNHSMRFHASTLTTTESVSQSLYQSGARTLASSISASFTPSPLLTDDLTGNPNTSTLLGEMLKKHYSVVLDQGDFGSRLIATADAMGAIRIYIRLY